MYNLLINCLEKKEIPNFIREQIKNFIVCSNEYIRYELQYDNLNKCQSTLVKYYPNPVGYLTISEKYFIELMYSIYKKKYNGSEYKFFSYYLYEIDTIKKDFDELLNHKKNNPNNLDYYSKIETISDKVGYLGGSVLDIKSLALQSLEESISLLKGNQKTVEIDMKNSYEQMYTKDFQNNILELLKSNNQNNYLALYFLISEIRRAFSIGEIKNFTPSGKKKKSLIVFQDKHTYNLEKLKKNINIILNKYPQKFIDYFESQKQEVDKLRELLNL